MGIRTSAIKEIKNGGHYNYLSTGNKSNALVGSWELDLKNNQLAWSSDQFKIYDYAPGSIALDKDFFLLKTTHYSELTRISKIIEDALATRAEYSFRRRIIKSRGRIGFAETNAKIFRDAKGLPEKIEGITVEIGGKLNNGTLDYNDPEFFNIYYSKFKTTLTYAIFKMVFDEELAKDLCQEVFIKAWNNMSKYDPDKGELYTWLINIARNHCKDYYKSSQANVKRICCSFDISAGEIRNVINPSLDKMEVENLLTQLPAEKRELIQLLFIEDYTQMEVAKIKNIPLGTVKTKSRAAIKTLRALNNFN